MSKVTPEEVLRFIAECINSGNLDSLMMLYESDACFASQPGQFIKGREGIRQSLQGFVDMRGKLESKTKRVFQTSNLALVVGPDLMAILLILLQQLPMSYVNSPMVHGVLA